MLKIKLVAVAFLLSVTAIVVSFSPARVSRAESDPILQQIAGYKTWQRVNNEPIKVAGGFQIDGAAGSEKTFIIDGKEVTNFRTGVLTG